MVSTHAPTRSAPRAPQRTSPKIDWRPMQDDGDEDLRFVVPQEVIPPGMDWQFKRYSSLALVDTEYQSDIARRGAWDPVPHEAWPEKLGRFGKPGEAIIVGGLILMQRPMAYTEKSKAKERAKAQSAVGDHFKSLALPDGAFPKAKVNVKMDYSTQLVPEDDAAE